jgi:ABC-type uncharacterized transport system permease subunit
MSPIMLPIALVAYIVGLFVAVLATFYGLDFARRVSTGIYVVAWLGHGAEVIRHGVTEGRFPLSSVAEYLLVLGLVVMTFFLLLWFRWHVEVLSVLLPPVAAAAGFAALALFRTSASTPVAASQGWFLFHTTVSTLGMATLVVALAMSLIYLFADRALKTRRTLKLLDRLPPLDRCDRIGFQALVLGFVLLSVGIATGVVVNTAMHDRFWIPGAKQTPALLAWVVFAGVLGARFRLGFRGRKSAYLTIAGVVLGLLTVAGMAV